MSAVLAKEAQPAPVAELTACAADLVACGSLEMSPDRVSDVRTVAALLPVGTKVYVNHLPRHALAGSLPTLNALREAGLEPVPHVAARRVLSRPELRSFLERAVGEAGVTKVLLIGGDDTQARGPYADAAGGSARRRSRRMRRARGRPSGLSGGASADRSCGAAESAGGQSSRWPPDKGSAPTW